MEKVKIGEVCDILNGYAFKSENYVDSGIRVIRIANVQKGYIEDISPAFYPINTSGLEKYTLVEGDLLISLTGNVGRVALLQKEMLPAALNQRVACLRLKSDIISKGYLFHILNNNCFEKQCIQSSKGVAQKNMSTEWLKEYEIPLYSKDKQKEITGILDKTRAIIKSRNQEIQKLDELVKARFVEMFGDPVSNSLQLPSMRGEEFFKLSNGKFVPVSKRFESGIPVYGGNGISWYTDEMLVSADTIIVGRVGFQSGNVNYAKGPLWVSDNAMYISYYDKESFDLLFLCHLMEHIDFTRHQDAGDLKKITQKPFMAMEYIHPPLLQQQEYTAFVAQLDKSKFVVQQALEKAQLLFDSLMQQYFG